MSIIVNYLLHPMAWLAVGFFILWRKWPRLKKGGRRFWGIVFGLFVYLTATPFLPQKLNAYLEDQYPPLNTQSLNTGLRYNIIVLGGGMGYDDRLPANSLLEPVMLVRLAEGIRIYRTLPQSLLITSGYSSIGRKPQAFVAREAAILLGVDSQRVTGLPDPTNTQQEAADYVKNFGTDLPLIVATSANHIPRAVYYFKKAGVKTVIPAPTHYKVKRQNPVSWKQYAQPGFQYWGDIQAALHEFAGLLVARFSR
jgi:uncharacterized SAM-binding protein YcdF (DUF218 family)